MKIPVEEKLTKNVKFLKKILWLNFKCKIEKFS